MHGGRSARGTGSDLYLAAPDDIRCPHEVARAGAGLTDVRWIILVEGRTAAEPTPDSASTHSRTSRITAENRSISSKTSGTTSPLVDAGDSEIVLTGPHAVDPPQLPEITMDPVARTITTVGTHGIRDCGRSCGSC